MNVFINTDDNKIALLNKLGEYSFSNDINTEFDVSVLLESKEIEDIISVIIKINCPTVVLVGNYENKDNSISKLFIDNGFPLESLIYKDNDVLKNYLGMSFKTPVPRGVGHKSLIELVNYAKDNKLMPELIIWNPSEHDPEDIVTFPDKKEQPVESKPVSKTRINEARTVYEAKFKEAKPDNTEAKAIIQAISIENYLKQFKKITLLLRTNSDTDTSDIIQTLSQRYKFTLLDITDKQNNYLLYGKDREEATLTGYYSFVEDNLVHAITPSTDTLLIEFDLLGKRTDLIDDLYVISSSKIFIPTSEPDETDIKAIRDWINNGLELNGILVKNQEALNAYKKIIGENVFTAEVFLI